LRQGSLIAARRITDPARAGLRRTRLARRPLRVGPAELREALGGSPRAVLRGAGLDALPTVARFEAHLDRASERERSELLAGAERIAAHRFDLLGSGETELGPDIDWQRDFKSGRGWPLVHISRVPIVFDDHSDIKVPWELSRFQHLPVLAAAHRLTGERRWLDEVGAQLRHWIANNPVEFGANWACTMDVAIRAANWTATLAMVAEPAEGEPWLEEALASLLLHARFIRGHLEYAAVRGNHYLADVVGLLAAAAPFQGSPEGRRWVEWAAAELRGELEHQVRADGCDHEASTAYHRLVCEMFVCGAQAVDALRPGFLDERFRTRLDVMLAVVADYTRPDGLAPQIGDADDGRYLPLGDYGRADPRSHLHLFAQARREPEISRGHAALPDGGLFVMRGAGLYAIVRCGDVGLGGLGAHAHNDQLSLELAYRLEPVIVDPGSYLYTASPAGRNAFRSTGFHATLRVGDAEQNELRAGALFAMHDRSRAEVLAWHADGARARFQGRHHGYTALDPPAIHVRTVEFDASALELSLTDSVIGAGTQALEWSFPLAPGASVEVREGRATVDLPSVRVVFESDGLPFRVDGGWYSPGYGRREPAPFLRARRAKRPGEDSTRITIRLSPRSA
jgi:hypothetical protein